MVPLTVPACALASEAKDPTEPLRRCDFLFHTHRPDVQLALFGFCRRGVEELLGPGSNGTSCAEADEEGNTGDGGNGTDIEDAGDFERYIETALCDV